MDRVKELILGDIPNYILPFFWQHGETEEELIKEIEAIHSCGIGAVCLESRTHEQFCEDKWWNDMEIILNECKKRDMKVWLLDDKHFPSGYANALIPKKYPHLRRFGITERHIDVTGPVKDGAVMLEEWKTAEDDILLGIIACERIPDENYDFSPYNLTTNNGQRLTGKTINLSSHVRDGMVYFDLPEGGWRIVYLFKTKSGVSDYFANYIDMMQTESTDVFIEAVYQPHYEHFKEYFGNTFAGFFSDEPQIGNNSAYPIEDEFGRAYVHFPYADCFVEELESRIGMDYICKLPSLWFDMGGSITPATRTEYMNIVTYSYKRNFCDKLGDWCRARNVMYIGHVIEDANKHTHSRESAGHFFRGLDGQDMAGIDVVLNQIVPGQTEYISAIPTFYEVSDPVFFHYALAKLGSSHAHIQKRKQGRAMCEIFGAYGWAEGTKMMKWLCDHMLVRGINYFVPHAFSIPYPDADCPPHFYAQGHNPQFKQFDILMRYMNRMCHLLNGGVHSCSVALLYHAEAEWSGGKYMYVQTPAKQLYDNQLDYDIISSDYLLEAEICENGFFKLNNEVYHVLVIPYSEYLPIAVIRRAYQFAQAGVKILYANDYPKASIEGEDISEYNNSNIAIAPLNELHMFVRECGVGDIKSDYSGIYLRSYHYITGERSIYMITNEDIHNDIVCKISFKDFHGGHYEIYDAFENKVYNHYSESSDILLTLPSYNSIVFIFGGEKSGVEETEKIDALVSSNEYIGEYTISISTQENPEFLPLVTTSKLTSINAMNGMERFAGNIKYDFTINISHKYGRKCMIDLGKVGESVFLTVNGKAIGDRIIPPYTFDVTDVINFGENNFTAIVTTHLGYKNRDRFSKFLLFEPTGLTDTVTLNWYQ